MARSALTGTRIRERRVLEGVKQADLARSVGISPAYLNLIEHNRRRIGGKLLNDLARELGVEPSQLTEGFEAPLMQGLQDAAAMGAVLPHLQSQSPTLNPTKTPEPESERAEEFAGRFPGWSALVVAQRDRIVDLERRVEALNDRLSHDPFLSESLHEVLSSVTAIRSTAGILKNTEEIDRDWQMRFHRNLYEDSQRLSEGAQVLVNYLDTIGKSEEVLRSPREEFEAWLAERHFAPPEIERGDMPDLSKDGPKSPAARSLARAWLLRARAGAERMPLAMIEGVLAEHGPDPSALAQATGVDLPMALRRLASLPPGPDRPPTGLVICDGSGAISLRKPIEGFAPPRLGTASPQWPFYQALLRPMQPIRRVLVPQGQPMRRYLSYTIAQPERPLSFDAPEKIEATMLLIPLEHTAFEPRPEEIVEIGLPCRICGQFDCGGTCDPPLGLARSAS